MMEATKAYARRKGDPFWNEVFVGDGLDLGPGPDPFRKEWFPGVRSVRTMDLRDGDAQNATWYTGSDRYDFVHASNCLEHLDHPLEALLGWLHVVKQGGHLVFTVPDEDLYEQGVFPSRWTNEHKWTFTLHKRESWSRRSIGLADLLDLLPSCRVRRLVLADTGYDRSVTGVDQTLGAAEAFWEVVVGKLPVPVRKRTFKHSGARGDLVYALAAMRAMGGGKLYVNRTEKSDFHISMCDEEMAGVKEFLGSLGFVDVEEWNGEKVDVDLDDFRKLHLGYNMLSDMQMMVFGAWHDHEVPWIDLDKVPPLHEADIVVNRSERYNSPFDWDELGPWLDRCVFVGSEQEHEAFAKITGMEMRRVRTGSWGALAGVIRGSKLFVGNQSMPYAMAEAMKLPRVLASYRLMPNCEPKGPGGHTRLTQDVIRACLEGRSAADRGRKTRSPDMCLSFKKAKCMPPRMSLVIPAVGTVAGTHALEKEALGFGCEADVVTTGGSFEEMANVGAARAKGNVICVADPRTAVSFADVGMVAQQLSGWRIGMSGACMSGSARPHVSGPCFAVTRLAYETAGLFNPRMRPGALNMLELNLRYGRSRFGCKSAGLQKWRGWTESSGDGAKENAGYIEKVYGVKP